MSNRTYLKTLAYDSTALHHKTSLWETDVEVQVTIDLHLIQIELPPAVQNRLQALLDRQDQGETLMVAERQEAEGLVALAEFLSLLRLRAEQAAASASTP